MAVSEVRTASVVSFVGEAEQERKQAVSLVHFASHVLFSFLLCLLFYPEASDSTFLRNFDKFLPDYMTSHTRR
jgi:hypothetical protein